MARVSGGPLVSDLQPTRSRGSGMERTSRPPTSKMESRTGAVVRENSHATVRVNGDRHAIQECTGDSHSDRRRGQTHPQGW